MSTKFAEGETYPSASVIDAARDKVAACAQVAEGLLGDATSREAWARAVAELLTLYLAVPNLEAARTQLIALDVAAQGHKSEPQLYGFWAEAAFDMIEAYMGTHSNVPAYNLMFSFIAQTPHAPPEDPAARRLWVARAARFGDIIGRFGDTKTTTAARPFLHGLAYAMEDALEDGELRALWAKAVLDFVAGYCRGNQKKSDVDLLGSAALMVDGLKRCALDYKHETYLRDQWAEAMQHLVKGYCSVGNGNEAMSRLAALKRNHDSLPDDLIIRIQWAKSAVRMVEACGVHAQIDRAHAMVDQLKQAVRKHPTDIELHTQWTRALWEMCRVYDSAERARREPRRQQKSFEESLSLIRDHARRAREGKPNALAHKPGEPFRPLQRYGPAPKPSLLEKWRERRYEKLSKQRAAQDQKTKRRFLKDAFRQVKFKCPNTPEKRALWAAQVENLFRVASFLPTAGLLDLGRGLETTLLQAALKYPDEPALRTQWSAATGALSFAVRREESAPGAPKTEESKAVVPEDVARVKGALLQSIKDFPQDPVLVAPWAEGAVGTLELVSMLQDADLRKTGGELVGVLQAAAETSPQDVGLRGHWIKGVRALLGAHKATFDANGAQVIFDEFERIVKKYPHDEALRQEYHKVIAAMLAAHRFDMAPYGTRPHDMKPHEAAMRGLLETLGQEVENEPENQELRKAWSWQVASSVAWQQVAPMRPFLDALKGASERYPDEPDLRAKWLDACFTILYRCHPHGQAEEARSVLSVLEAEARADPQDGEFRRTWVHRAHLFNDELKRVNEDDASAAVQGQIGQMIADYPDEPNLARKHEPVPDEYRWSM